MNKPIVRSRPTLSFEQIVGAALLLILLIGSGSAQTTTTSATDGYTPTGLQPGAPAGSYALSGFETVNPYNGGLNFNLPLLKIGGRGTAGYSMQLPIEQKWVLEHNHVDNGMGNAWDFYLPRFNDWNPSTKPGYGPGVLIGRPGGFGYIQQMTSGCTDCYIYSQTLMRLTFVSPDGTEYELRDELTGGRPAQNSSTTTVGASRGTVFKSADGTSVTFISDQVIHDDIYIGGLLIYPSGSLMFKDGTRYTIVNGGVTQIRDRNGNTISFQGNVEAGIPVTKVTDSLGREVTIEYQVQDPQYGLSDIITYKGFGGATRKIHVSYTTLDSALRPGSSLQTYGQLFPDTNASSSETHNPTVISSVWLPDGSRRYKFLYNSYGELARVELPTGGAFEYDWTGGIVGGSDSGQFGYDMIYRRVVTRRVFENGNTQPISTTTFSRPDTMRADGAVESVDYVTVHTTGAGDVDSTERHYYHGNALSSLSGTVSGDGTAYPEWNEGKEYKTEILDTNGATLRRVENTWQQRASVSWWNPSLGAEPPNDPRQVETVTTLENNLVSKQSSISPIDGSVGFDQFNNQTDVWEYDYGQGAPGALIRRTHTSYLTTNPANSLDYTSTGIHIRNLPASIQVKNGTGTQVAYTEFAYDESGYQTDSYGSITGWANPGTSARGNVTTTRRWLDTTNDYLQAHARYDQAGNVRYAIDAKGNQSEIKYDDAYSDNVARNTYAYPTRAVSAVPDPDNNHSTNVPLEINRVYDYSTGLIASATDSNSQTTEYFYNDTLDRPTQLNRPDGGTTTFSYGDTVGSLYVKTRVLRAGTQYIDSWQYFDGLGRAVRSFRYENQDTNNAYLTADTKYDALGRVYMVSNPYRSSSLSSTVNPTGSWATTAYDALGRVTSVTTPDGAQVGTSYSGNTVTVTDQAGKKRKSVSDALGRLTQVIEDPTTGGYNYQTTYAYDALGNLRQVTQDSQHRYFMYDSLSRLIRARNPEQDAYSAISNLTDPVTGNDQWSMAYSYDENGNLTQKIDARGRHVNYSYDNLNRNTVILYRLADNETVDPDTPDVERLYDRATNGKGRPWITWTWGSARSKTITASYDAVGRVTTLERQFYANNTWSPAYDVIRQYDLAGNVAWQKYPSQRTVDYSFDQAGRTSGFTGNLGDSVTRTYASSISYDEWGGLSREQFGTDTPLYHKERRNIRGQLYDVRLSTVNDADNWDRGAIVNYYSQPTSFGGSGTDNNGNLLVQESYVPNAGGTSSYMKQSYAYDHLNRLSSVAEYQNGTTSTGGQSYGYDRYGNRTISSVSGAGINGQQFTVDANRNRLGVPGGQSGVMQYDANGNLTNDTYSGAGSRTYDAENRMVRATNSDAQQSVYTYDADGMRVRRNSYGQEVWQVYGIDGELLAEYAASASPSSPQKEYGYRNGQLLITVSPSSSGWGAAPTFDDNPLVAGVTTIQSRHITQLRDAINALRTHLGMQAYSWQTSAAPGDWITAATIEELRTALDQALGPPSPAYIPGLAQGMPILKGHIQELRERVLAAWNSGTSGADIRWMVTDHLGTPRIVADKSGSLSGIRRHDYLPFGEELYAGTGGRTASQGYAADDLRQKFTQKERDVETGLDYFLARYYSSSQGRFTSPDPGPFTLADPQSWNRYAYVQNSPVKFIDPTGETLVLTGRYADYIVQELERYTGLNLKRDSKTGVVTIDTSTKRKTKGTSEELANKLDEITTDQNTEVKIGTGVNQRDTFFDNFDTRELDIADYNVLKKGDPAFAATSLGHVLEEYYQAEKQYSALSQVEKFDKAHDDGLKFEAKVLSDFTKKNEQTPKEVQPNDPKMYRFVYTSVSYDIRFKSATGQGQYQPVRVTKINNKKPGRP